MADYTTISDATLTTGQPILATTGRALRDNPIAIAEGRTGAPRILLPALERIEAGNTIRSRIDDTVSAKAKVTGHGFAFIQTGSVRVTFEHRVDVGDGSAELVRIRNGSETVLAAYASTTSYVARTADVSIIPGDFVYVRNKNNSTTYSAYLRNVRFLTSGANLWPAPDGVRLENTYA